MSVVVFVHGVATRDNDEFKIAVSARDRRFRDTIFGDNLSILNCYWGKFGAAPRWHLASIPEKAGAVPLGGVAEAVGAEVDDNSWNGTAGDEILRAARADFAATLTSLSIEEITVLEAADDEAALADAEQFWLAATRYAVLSPYPDWLDTVANDEAFLAQLRLQLTPLLKKDVSLGLVSGAAAAAHRIGGALSNTVNRPFAWVGREKISPTVAVFLGDVFRFLKDGESRDAIQAEVIEKLVAGALEAKQKGKPLILIGHSLGGIILYDLLSDETAMAAIKDKLGEEFRASLLLTVGSQVGLFEELKLFAASDDAYGADRPPPQHKVKLPDRIERWWNVYDQMDILSFVASPVFDGVEDYAVDTIAGVKGAHSAYFSSMTFYERLRVRLVGAGLVT